MNRSLKILLLFSRKANKWIMILEIDIERLKTFEGWVVGIQAIITTKDA